MKSPHFNTKAVTSIKAMFSDEGNYKKHMNNLYKTREGLNKILESRPELKIK